MLLHRLAWAVALWVALTANARTAAAQSGDAGAAESLFQTGKTLLEEKDYAQACPKLAESYRIDPGTGTLLALALCHEGEGRLASAWGEFSEVAARSRREGRPDRQELARQRMAALEARLPMLTISLAPGGEKIEKLEIKRDGNPVGVGSLASPVPVDPGHHHVEASAPGYKPFIVTVSVGADADRKVVIVPVLERDASAEPSADPGHENSRAALRYAGFAAGGVGVVGLVVGTVFGVRAIGLNNDSKGGCDAQSTCSASAFAARNDARSAGTVSTVAFVAGGVLVATGATLLFLGKSRSAATMAIRAAPIVSERELGIGVVGAF